MTEDAGHPEAESRGLERRRSRTRLAVLAVTFVCATVGAAILFIFAGDDELTTEAVTATLRVDGMPNGLAAGPDALWVALNDQVGEFDAKLERLNLASGAVEQSVQLRGVLTETRKIGESVWTEKHEDWFDRKPSELVELDWLTGRIRSRLAFDRTSFAFVPGNGSLWIVVGRNPATLIRIDQRTRKPLGKPVTLSPNRVIGLEYGEKGVWASAFEDGVLIRFDPATGRIDKVRVGDNPVGIAVGDGSVWVANRASGSVSRVESATMQVVDTVHVGTYPTWVAAAGDSIWVSNQGDGTVTRIDARTAEVVGAPIKIGSPVGDAAAHVVAVAPKSLWVASWIHRTVSRIDTQR